MGVVMDVVILEEAGFSAAMEGLALSYKVDIGAAINVSDTLFRKDGGHNKFLEQLMMWVKVRAPRDWWQEADTYRLSTKQSESTMHTLVREITMLYPNGVEGLITYSDNMPYFENPEEECSFIDRFKNDYNIRTYIENNFENGYDSIHWGQWAGLVEACFFGDIPKVKRRLPEGFLQTRIWSMSYKTLRNIIFQRDQHRMPHWPAFVEKIRMMARHPEYLSTEIRAMGSYRVDLVFPNGSQDPQD
jgi:hypothetical protein